MTEVEIIKRFNGTYPLSYNSLLEGETDAESSKTKDNIITLFSNGVLKSNVDDNTLEVMLRVYNVHKANTIVHLHELSEELKLDNLRLRILSNEDDLPCKPGKEYGDEKWFERNKRELYLAEREDGKFAILDHDGNMHFHDWFDNVCLVTWQGHPCYPENTEFGIVVMKNHKFACVKQKGEEHPHLSLMRDMNDFLRYTELTPFTARQYMFEYKTCEGVWKDIYQSFWGYERTWARTVEDITVQYDENISYYENIMANSNPYRPSIAGKENMTYEEFLETYVPYYIMFRGHRKFYTHSKEELEEFLAKYDADKKNGNLKEYERHYTI